MPYPRRIFFLFLATVAVGLLVGVWLVWPRTAITLENAERIEPGMTMADVVAILCALPGDYGTGRRGVVLDLFGGGVLMNEGELRQWGGDEGFIQIGFDANDTVIWKRFVPAGEPWPAGPLDMLRYWLGV